MKKVLFILLIASCTSKPQPKRPAVTSRMAEIRAEIKRLDDSVKANPSLETYKLPDSVREQLAWKEGQLNRRYVRLEMEHDSLAALITKFKVDSTAKANK